MVTRKITSSQRGRLIQIMENGIDTINISKGEIQLIIESEERFQFELGKFIKNFQPRKYSQDEKLKNSYIKQVKYRPREISEQVNIIRKLFPEVYCFDKNFSKRTLPLGADGWFAIPQWQKISPTYGEAVKKVLSVIKMTTNNDFYSPYHENDEFDSKLIRQSNKLKLFLKKISEEQREQDILVVPAQFGDRYNRCSIYEARQIMKKKECGLGSFAVGIMLLTHLERLANCNDLSIDCAGDELAADFNDTFSKSSCFKYNSEIIFEVKNILEVSENCSSASMFIS